MPDFDDKPPGVTGILIVGGVVTGGVVTGGVVTGGVVTGGVVTGGVVTGGVVTGGVVTGGVITGGVVTGGVEPPACCTVIENARVQALRCPSLTPICTLRYEPICGVLTVPDRTPVLVLKLAQYGLSTME